MANNIYGSGMTPVNRLAGVVIGNGVHYEPKINPSTLHDRREAYPVRALPQIPPFLRNLVDFRFGFFRVIGMAAEKKGLWVVRCSCGMYSYRRTHAICNPKNLNDACVACSQLWKIKRDDLRRRTGKDIKESDVPGAHVSRNPLPPPSNSVEPYISRKLGAEVALDKKVKKVKRVRKVKSVSPRSTTERRAVPTAMELAMEQAKLRPHSP